MEELKTFTIPQIAADSGDVYLVWDDYRTGDSNVLFARSTDGGLTWSSPISVNDVKTDQQFFSTIAVSGGVISVAWYDSRLGQLANGTITGLDVFYATSINGGSGFSSSIRITSASFNPNIVLRTDGANTNEPLIGDYIDISANKGTFYPIWSDNRNVCDTIDPVYGCIHQDIYTVPEKLPLQLGFVSTLDSSTITINGTAIVDRTLERVSANLTVKSANTLSGVTTFQKTYSVANLTMSPLQPTDFRTRFLLNISVLPYALNGTLL